MYWYKCLSFRVPKFPKNEELDGFKNGLCATQYTHDLENKIKKHLNEFLNGPLKIIAFVTKFSDYEHKMILK